MARWWDCGHEYAMPALKTGAVAGEGSFLRFVSNPGRRPDPPTFGDSTMVKADGVWITCSLGCCIAQ
jgi:hypothetical protein